MKYKYLGILNANIAHHWNILEHKNKPILVFDDRIKHVNDNHLKDFGSYEKIKESYEKLPLIIKKPDYVFYDKEKEGLEYYKYINENICAVVRIKSGKTLKVRSWYPVKESKITNRQKKEIKSINNREIVTS